MELTELKNKIIESFSGSASDLEEVLQMVDDDQSIFPFNEYEHLICNLIERGGLTYEQYIDIRTEYISANPNLWVFEISAPRGFGEKFAQTYVQGKCSKLKSPGVKAVKIAILDGVLFIEGKNKMYKSITETYKDYNIMSALVLREFLYQI